MVAHSAIIDLRSDTVTQPSPEMRQAIATAEVGDDVWGEDPTVLRLQEEVARLLDKAEALFVPSGTMANQIALLTHTRPGEEVLVGWGCHCVTAESGAGAAFAGVLFQVLGDDGMVRAEQIAQALRPPDVHHAPTRLVWLENTHNASGGRILPQHEVEAACSLAHEHGLLVHLDGARLLNAAVASGQPARELVASVDSTSICLSKGLGAPVGSVLAGTHEFIARARRYRKMLGGGMRQAGILAAAGLYALEHNIARLAEDHANARLLAEELARVPGLKIAPERVQTNILFFTLCPPADPAALTQLTMACRERGLLLDGIGRRRIRAVTHLGVTREQCLAAAGIVQELLA